MTEHEELSAAAMRIAVNHGQVSKSFGAVCARDTTASMIERLVNDRITALEALAAELGVLLGELIDIEGPQPGTSDWAVKVKRALSSPLLAELLGKSEACPECGNDRWHHHALCVKGVGSPTPAAVAYCEDVGGGP